MRLSLFANSEVIRARLNGVLVLSIGNPSLQRYISAILRLMLAPSAPKEIWLGIVLSRLLDSYRTERIYSLLADLVILAGLDFWFSKMKRYFNAESPKAAGLNNEY